MTSSRLSVFCSRSEAEKTYARPECLELSFSRSALRLRGIRAHVSAVKLIRFEKERGCREAGRKGIEATRVCSFDLVKGTAES